MKAVLLITMLIFSSSAIAKYRAYRLLIQNELSGTEREIVSTMDHIQYPGYYHLNAGEKVFYLDSWMCWGNTSGFKPICSKPESQASVE